MIRIRILLLILSFGAPPLLAEDSVNGSVFVEFLEYRFANDAMLLDAEAEYGSPSNQLALKFVAVSAHSDTETAAALLYRRTLSRAFDLQAGVEFSGDTNNLVLGFQAQAPHHINTEVLTLFNEHGDGRLIAKIERDFGLTERLVLWPRLEIFAAFQDDEADATAKGLSFALADLRLRYEVSPRFMPYVGVSWERALGDSATMLEAAGEEYSVVTAVAGASFAF